MPFAGTSDFITESTAFLNLSAVADLALPPVNLELRRSRRGLRELGMAHAWRPYCDEPGRCLFHEKAASGRTLDGDENYYG